MKLINSKSQDEFLARTNRKFEAELLRELRMENTQRSVAFFGWFALSALGIVSVLVIILLLGLGIIALSDKVVVALIIATVAGGRAMFSTIIKSLFSRNE